ncbi:hypothetical protein Ahy_B01g051836 [Arachis hypogaea]|uniref:Transposase MuDR plant domain-containing protein n=1 Tax=Arachis hypogaea TaxID=3818 RepID=A0A445AMV7_ARAHY|nr:hypothetical protein Ahy_B01g051836 [Arachis hypogaea]
MDMANIRVKEDTIELYVVHKTSNVHKGVDDVQVLGNAETTMEVENGEFDGPKTIIVTYEAHESGQVKRNVDPKVNEDIETKINGPDSNEDGKQECSNRNEDRKEESGDGSEDQDYELKGNEDGSEDSWGSNSREGYATDNSAAKVVFSDSDDDNEGAEGGDKGKEKIVGGLGDEDEGYESEDFLDVPISDDEDNNIGKKYPLHKQLKNLSDYKWEVGTLYVGIKEFEDCATAYAVHTGRGLKFSKGLVPTFDELIPRVDYRFCVRHLYYNFKKRFSWLQLKLMILLQKAKYIECYQHVVYPVNGPNMWTKTPFDDVLPLVYRKPIGRPKSKRNKIANEHQTRGGVSRKGQNQKCRYVLLHANKVAGSISKRSSKGISTTISTQASQQSQVASKSATLSRSKRKSSTSTMSTQQSQATSKKTKEIPSNNASG